MADWRIAAVLIVKDIEASVRYYRDQLGFDRHLMRRTVAL